MTRFLGCIGAGLVLLCLAAVPWPALSTGRPVPTELIIVPPEDSAATEPAPAMPVIPAPGTSEEAPSDQGTVEPGETAPTILPDANVLPMVEYDPAKLPTPVRRLREQIIEAAHSGDPEKLRPIIEANDEPPVFGSDETGDQIEQLKSLSGDAEGREILAILIEVLEAGYVHVDVGTPNEVYLWPYFARYPVDKLTPPQIVELFKIVFAGDYEDMQADGQYQFYRVGLAPNGTWKYFVSGD